MKKIQLITKILAVIAVILFIAAVETSDTRTSGYDANLDLIKVSNQTAAAMKYTSPENLTSGFEDEAAGTYRYVFDISNSGYKYLSLPYKFYAATADDQLVFTLWGTNNSDADASADTGWIDMSLLLLGVANVTTTNTTNTGMIIRSTPLPISRLMIKIVCTYGGGGSADNSSDLYLVRTN